MSAMVNADSLEKGRPMTPERDALVLAKRVISSHLDTLEAKQVAAALISTSEKLERARATLMDIANLGRPSTGNMALRALADIGPAEPIPAEESQG